MGRLINLLSCNLQRRSRELILGIIGGVFVVSLLLTVVILSLTTRANRYEFCKLRASALSAVFCSSVPGQLGAAVLLYVFFTPSYFQSVLALGLIYSS